MASLTRGLDSATSPLQVQLLITLFFSLFLVHFWESDLLNLIQLFKLGMISAVGQHLPGHQDLSLLWGDRQGQKVECGAET